MKRLLGAAVGCALIASTAAYAAGFFPGFPIVGGAAYCQGLSSYSTSVTVPGTVPTPNQCNSTAPAGPSIVTGNELIPADTSLSNQAPATVLLPMASLHALPLNVSTVTNNVTTQLTPTNVTGGYVIHSTGTITGIQMWMPASPIDGQQFAITADQSITTLTINLTGSQTMSNKPTALTTSTTASYGYAFMYNAAAGNWYRLQ